CAHQAARLVTGGCSSADELLCPGDEASGERFGIRDTHELSRGAHLEVRFRRRSGIEHHPQRLRTLQRRPDTRLVCSQAICVRDAPAAVVVGTDATLEGGCRAAADDLTVVEAFTVTLERDPGVARMPRELQDCAALREVPHESSDLRIVSWLTPPGEQELVVLPSVVLEAVLPVHVESRLQGRECRRALAELVQDDAHLELRDGHRTVVE